MSKKLDTSAIKSGLEGSAFFPARQPVSPTPSEHTESAVVETTARPGDEPADRSTDRPTGKQVMIRRGFEWYGYQLAALKKLSLEEQLADEGDGSMSRMVREALDEYLIKKGVLKK